jgi:hypothetical protein
MQYHHKSKLNYNAVIYDKIEYAGGEDYLPSSTIAKSSSSSNNCS